MAQDSIGGVHFFGGTMWTNFNNANENSMFIAQQQMNGCSRIMPILEKCYSQEILWQQPLNAGFNPLDMIPIPMP